MNDDYYSKKNDQGKTDWSLLPWRAIESAARIMTIAIAPKEQGGKGYGLASWQDVPEGFYRYWAAILRHTVRRFVYGEIIDTESGEPHMGHVICNAAFMFEKDRQLLEEGKYDKNFYERKIEDPKEQLFDQPNHEEKHIIKRTLSQVAANIPTLNEVCRIKAEEVYKENELYCTNCGITYKKYLETDCKCKYTADVKHRWDRFNNEI